MATCGQTRGKKKKRIKRMNQSAVEKILWSLAVAAPYAHVHGHAPRRTGCSLGVLLVARLHPRGQRRVKAGVFSLPFHFFYFFCDFFYFCILQNHLPWERVTDIYSHSTVKQKKKQWAGWRWKHTPHLVAIFRSFTLRLSRELAICWGS